MLATPRRAAPQTARTACCLAVVALSLCCCCCCGCCCCWRGTAAAAPNLCQRKRTAKRSKASRGRSSARFALHCTPASPGLPLEPCVVRAVPCVALCCAVCCAVLCCAVLCCAVLCCAVLCCAVLCCAACCAVPCWVCERERERGEERERREKRERDEEREMKRESWILRGRCWTFPTFCSYHNNPLTVNPLVRVFG